MYYLHTTAYNPTQNITKQRVLVPVPARCNSYCLSARPASFASQNLLLVFWFILYQTLSISTMIALLSIFLVMLSPLASAFITPPRLAVSIVRLPTQIHMAEGEKLAKQVTGEELEKMLQEWEMPLVVDAYATW